MPQKLSLWFLTFELIHVLHADCSTHEVHVDMYMRTRSAVTRAYIHASEPQVYKMIGGERRRQQQSRADKVRERERERQTHRQTVRQAHRLTDRPTGRETDRHRDKESEKETGTKRERERKETGTKREREREREQQEKERDAKDREIERERERDERLKKRNTYKDTDGKKEKQRQGEKAVAATSFERASRGRAVWLRPWRWTLRRRAQASREPVGLGTCSAGGQPQLQLQRSRVEDGSQRISGCRPCVSMSPLAAQRHILAKFIVTTASDGCIYPGGSVQASAAVTLPYRYLCVLHTLPLLLELLQSALC